MTTEQIQVIIQAIGLISIVFLIISYFLDRKWKRAEAAYIFYNGFDKNPDCQLAMFMLDYRNNDTSYFFDYEFAKLNKTIHVEFNTEKRKLALTKDYRDLNDEEQVIRYIFDVFIGYLERVLYLIKQKYFTQAELIFYKYWLDILISPDCSEIRNYAIKNSCGLFVPFLLHYKKKVKNKLDKKIEFNSVF